MTTPSTDSAGGASWAGVSGRSRKGSVSSRMATTAAVRASLGVNMAWLSISGGITCVPAPKDAPPVVGVVKLGARHGRRRRALVDLGREQHAEERRGEVDPEARPELGQE